MVSMMASTTDTLVVIRLVLGVARLGEADLRGWWRSHGLDRTGSYVLSGALRRTWRPAALELDIAAAGRLHDELLGRPSALHLFSDHLPFRRWALGWLAEQKTAREDALLDVLERWDQASAIAGLRGWTAGADVSAAEPIGAGLLLGALTTAEMADSSVLTTIAMLLAAAYLDQGAPLRPPYFDQVP